VKAPNVSFGDDTFEILSFIKIKPKQYQGCNTLCGYNIPRCSQNKLNLSSTEKPQKQSVARGSSVQIEQVAVCQQSQNTSTGIITAVHTEENCAFDGNMYFSTYKY
jgi:hypothetical protein